MKGCFMFKWWGGGKGGVDFQMGEVSFLSGGCAPWGALVLMVGGFEKKIHRMGAPPLSEALLLMKNSKNLESVAGAVLQYTTELITRFFHLVSISAVITAGIFNRVETDCDLTQ